MNILIIDDEPAFRDYLAIILVDIFQHQVTKTSSYHEAMKLPLKKISTFDMAFVDLQMPIMDGFQSGLQLKQHLSSIVTIMLTAHPSMEKGIKALRDYEFDDFLIKEDLEDVQEYLQLKNALRRAEKLAAARKALSNEYQLSDVLRSQFSEVHSKFVGTSEPFIQLSELIDKVAPTNSTVLITGETGTGKELVAREIHRKSLRNQRPFIPINCSAIPYALLESELFGHKRGAFTGAVGDRDGFFKLAEKGTLFLDEIGDMPIELQAKLLRVLEEKQFFPVGSGKMADVVKIDIRIISATHQNLNQKIKEGTFRQDLFFRLNTIILDIPPLRNRYEDINPLMDYFIQQKSGLKKITGIQPDALNMIKKWPWSGNVRELQNMTERAILFCDSEYLDCKDFPIEVQDHAIKFPQPSEIQKLSVPENQFKATIPLMKNKPSNDSFSEPNEKLWNTFEKNAFKLWNFTNQDDINDLLGEMMKGAKYIKKGHSARLIVEKEFNLIVQLKYINVSSGELENIEINYEFQSETSNRKNKSLANDHSLKTGSTYTQPVLKGLPDTYLFNILYPPAPKNDLEAFSSQRVIRALILRYALFQKNSSTLKSVFSDTMSFLFDSQLVDRVSGLSNPGLEAVRAYLCGADHIFAGMARKLKNEPELVVNEIRVIFPDFIIQ